MSETSEPTRPKDVPPPALPPDLSALRSTLGSRRSSEARGTANPPPRADLALIALRNAREDARRRPSSRPTCRPRPSAPAVRPDPVTLSTTILELISQARWITSPGTDLLTQWPSIVGETIYRHLSLVTFDTDTGVLTLRPSSQGWLVQARLLSERLIERINDRLGSTAVRAIRLQSPGATGPSLRETPAGQTPVQRQDHSDSSIPTRSTSSAPPLDDPETEAARARQARCTPREPVRLPETKEHDVTPGRQMTHDAVHIRALLHARRLRARSA
ncbi:DciA family protein [Streptomyces youssoufiensis]